MSTETDIRRRWKDTPWWGFREERDQDDDIVVILNGPTGEFLNIGGELDPQEVAFYRQAAAAPEDIHRLLAIIDALRQENAALKAGALPAEMDRGSFFITLTEEDIRRVELLYQAGQLTYEQEHAKKRGISPADYAPLDEVMDEFVSGAIDLTWDMAQSENGSTNGPMVNSA